MSADAVAARLADAGVLGYTPVEVKFVYDTLERFQPDLIVEWGTNVGHSARVFHEARVELGLDCDLHSVDSVDLVPVLRSADAGLARGHHVADLDVTLHVGDGALVAGDLFARSRSERPLFFLDTSHDPAELYEHLTYLLAMAPEALMLIHDVRLNDVTIRRFLGEEGRFYDADEVSAGQCMVRLWPR